ncbi:hypothetical protein [Brevibacillus migulae]|uniref:hypothetical protein n=1 Tax=Brevibacillus migulae TaxID=1644114 RepID=UPI001431DDB1|nr:hypothetical protein [Brevibacillus migulae]
MRQSRNGIIARESSKKLFSVDFHDFLEKESTYNDVELSQEFQISIQDIQRLRHRMKR